MVGPHENSVYRINKTKQKPKQKTPKQNSNTAGSPVPYKVLMSQHSFQMPEGQSNPVCLHRQFSKLAQVQQKPRVVSVLAGVNLLPLGALLALHVAAPTHLALARARHHPALRVVAPAAADAVAVLVLVTFPSRGAGGVATHQAEARGVVNVDEIRSPWDLIAVAGDGFFRGGNVAFPRGLVGGAAHLERGLVFLLQLLADLVEGGELPPARPDGAGAGHAVAFAGGLHAGFDDLQTHTRPQRESVIKASSKT